MTLGYSFIKRWERMAWRQDSRTFSQSILSPFSRVYAHFASREPERVESLPAPVISVGNLTVGGSGKTPLTIFLADWIQNELSVKVAILSRGYKKKNPQDLTVVSNGSSVLLTPLQAGDEAFLAAKRLPHAVVITAPDRFKAGTVATLEYGVQVCFLDDGFQHRRLKRDLDLVIVDGERGLGNGMCLPAGPLREPVEALDRADWLGVYQRPGIDSERTIATRRFLESRTDRIVEINASAELREVVFQQTDSPQLFGTGSLQGDATGSRWFLVSALANNDSFRQTALAQNLTVGGERFFQDHYAYSRQDCKEIRSAAQRSGCHGILTTEKDLWKLLNAAGGDFEWDVPLFVVSLRLQLGQGGEAFLADVKRKCL